MDIDTIALAWATDDELEILSGLETPTTTSGSDIEEGDQPTQCFKFRGGAVWLK